MYLWYTCIYLCICSGPKCVDIVFLHLFSTGPKRNPIESLSPCLINSEPYSTDSNGEYSKNHWHLWKPGVMCKLHQLHQTHITIGTYWSTNQWLSSVQDPGRTARRRSFSPYPSCPKETLESPIRSEAWQATLLRS